MIILIIEFGTFLKVGPEILAHKDTSDDCVQAGQVRGSQRRVHSRALGKNCKQSTNREDSSDFDGKLAESIASPQSFISKTFVCLEGVKLRKNFANGKIFRRQ